MKPALAEFFASMDAYFAGRTDGAALPPRFSIYGRFVRSHVRNTLEKVYPLCQQAVPAETWQALADGFYATRPARHFELNRAVESFPTFVADSAERLGLPDFLPSLATFEWTDLEVYMDEALIPGTATVTCLTPNPTLRVLEHPFRLCDYALAPKPRPARPEAMPELALLWRNPQSHLTNFLRADAAALLVLKLAVEGLQPAEAAAAGGVPEADIRAEITRLARAGMVLECGA